MPPTWYHQWTKLVASLLPLHMIEVRKSNTDTRSGQRTIEEAISFIGQVLSDVQNVVMSWRGLIATPSDFPEPQQIDSQFVFLVLNSVTDNDPTRTNTGQSFAAGDLIVWDGFAWTIIASNGSTNASTNTVYTFPNTMAAGSAFNTQTGVYFGGVASLDGPPVTLESSGSLFVSNGNTQVYANGLLLHKGASPGTNDAQWVSPTGLSFSFDLYTGDKITIISTT